MATKWLISVVNNSGRLASDLHVTFTGTGNSVKVEPRSVLVPGAGCPAPAVPSNPPVATNEVVIDWGWDCVPNCATVWFAVETPFGPLGFASGHWTGHVGGQVQDIAPVGAGDITVSQLAAADPAQAAQGQVAQAPVTQAQVAIPRGDHAEDCGAAPCREVTYTFALHLTPPVLVSGADTGCAPTPSPAQQQEIETQIVAGLRRKFPDRPATCGGEHCECIFDHDVSTPFDRAIPPATYRASTDPDLPIGWCEYALGGTVTVTRRTRTGGCEPR